MVSPGVFLYLLENILYLSNSYITTAFIPLVSNKHYFIMKKVMSEKNWGL